MSLPFFENESHPQQTRPMMIGVLVDQQDSCQFFGASWQRIPGSRRFEYQEWERCRSSVSEYYPYDLQITQCFRKELAAERDRGAVDPLVVYLDEFDEKLASFCFVNVMITMPFLGRLKRISLKGCTVHNGLFGGDRTDTTSTTPTTLNSCAEGNFTFDAC